MRLESGRFRMRRCAKERPEGVVLVRNGHDFERRATEKPAAALELEFAKRPNTWRCVDELVGSHLTAPAVVAEMLDANHRRKRRHGEQHPVEIEILEPRGPRLDVVDAGEAGPKLDH